MKANELMIGDWVLINGTPRKVQAVDGVDNEIMADDLLYTLAEDRYHSEDKVEGVPITPEILEKNGFGLIGERFVFGEIDDALVELKVSINNSYRAKISVADLTTSHNGWIMYVHQLQHALRLCCIDKEITI